MNMTTDIHLQLSTWPQTYTQVKMVFCLYKLITLIIKMHLMEIYNITINKIKFIIKILIIDKGVIDRLVDITYSPYCIDSHVMLFVEPT